MSKIILQIKKRSGEMADFDEEKILTAAKKAFTALNKNVSDDTILQIADNVIKELERNFSEEKGNPSVEHVQDLVEREIMKEGYFDVAKAYILYRYEHTKERQKQKEDVIEKIEKDELTIEKSNGKTEKFSIEKLKKSLSFAVKGFENIVDMEAILKQTRS